MDYAVCHILYVDRAIGGNKIVRPVDVVASESGGLLDSFNQHADGYAAHARVVRENLCAILETSDEINTCVSGKACVQKLAELHEAALTSFTPTLVLIDIPGDDVRDFQQTDRSPSPTSHQKKDSLADEMEEKFYGLSLLRYIVSDITANNLTQLIVPVAVLSLPEGEEPDESNLPFASQPAKQITKKLLDAGAVDVLTSPLLPQRLPSLSILAYRARKESMTMRKDVEELRRGRKRSWVGLDDQKPYAYLREAMVSTLMDSICRLDNDDPLLATTEIKVLPERCDEIRKQISTWYFSAHELSDDELLVSAVFMLEHALAMDELEEWRQPTERLKSFLLACRAAYNTFVPYHNFRHVIDVMQACFHFLVKIGVLNPYHASSAPVAPEKSPIAALLRPFDALTLLITAIGHDVGHPGVNNAFLVSINAPLAQLYNDRSVLESFHCAAYSQILRRWWPAAFTSLDMRQLMISSILATDMGLHFDYMKRLGQLEEKLFENKGTDGWNIRMLDEFRTLACSLLIKCADISNVARRYAVAAKWTMILTDEFSRQASMERDLAIPSALFAPPVREIVELGRSQIGFMNMFAIPLFQAVSDIMPAMGFTVDELVRNRKIWEEKIVVEKAKRRRESQDSSTTSANFSPMAPHGFSVSEQGGRKGSVHNRSPSSHGHRYTDSATKELQRSLFSRNSPLLPDALNTVSHPIDLENALPESPGGSSEQSENRRPLMNVFRRSSKPTSPSALRFLTSSDNLSPRGSNVQDSLPGLYAAATTNPSDFEAVKGDTLLNGVNAAIRDLDIADSGSSTPLGSSANINSGASNASPHMGSVSDVTGKGLADPDVLSKHRPHKSSVASLTGLKATDAIHRQRSTSGSQSTAAAAAMAAVAGVKSPFQAGGGTRDSAQSHTNDKSLRSVSGTGKRMTLMFGGGSGSGNTAVIGGGDASHDKSTDTIAESEPSKSANPVESLRHLGKSPGRNRFRFWKNKKPDVPVVDPARGGTVASEEVMAAAEAGKL